MQSTQRRTACQVHVIPARSITPDDVFKARQAAQAAGCEFVRTPPRSTSCHDHGPFGGDAA